MFKHIYKIYLIIVIAVLATFGIHQIPVINNTVNFDRFFEVDDTLYHGTLEEVQASVDDGYMTLYYGVYHHHATDEMLKCMHACEEGMHVIIDDIEYCVHNLHYIDDISTEANAHWLYSGNVKVVCCTTDELPYSRWVLELRAIAN